MRVFFSRILAVLRKVREFFNVSRTKTHGGMPVIFADSISAPISRLKEAALEIGRGNFEARVAIDTRDEFGELASAFNEMAEQIAARTVRLENELDERRSAENALRESEAEYRALVQASSKFVWTVDENGNADELQKWWQGLTGQTPAQSKGWGWFDAVHEEEREATRREWQKAFFKREVFEAEYRILTRGGEYRWYAMRAVPVEGSEGSKKWVGTMSDVNERRLQAEAIRKSEQFMNLFRLANDAILIIEPETETVLNVNDKACEVYGLTREQFIGCSIKEISKNVERGEEQLNRLLEKGTHQSFESVQFHSSGKPIDFLINSSVIEYEGKLAVLTINRDITERKRTEEALRRSEEHFRSVARSAQDAIISADGRGKIIFWNEGAHKIFGYTEEEAVGRSLEMIMPASHRAMHQRELEKNADGGENRLIGKTLELPGLRKNGEEFPLELSLGAWESGDGGKCFTATVRDISERKRAEEKLQNSLSILTSTFEATDDGILVIDRADKVVTFNQKFVQMWNLCADDMNPGNGESMAAKISGQLKDADAFFEHVEQIRQTPTVVRRDLMRLADGKIYERYTQPQVLDGEIVGRVFSFRDITTRVRSEEAVREREEQFRSVVTSAQDAIVSADSQGRIVFWNNAAQKIFGYCEDEVIGQPLTILMPDSYAPGHQSAVSRHSETSETKMVGRRIDVHGRRKDGSEVSLDISTSAWESSGGKFFTAVIRDVTERRQAEEKLLALASIVESSHDAIIGKSLEGVITSWNNGARRIFGYEAAEAVGRHISILFPPDRLHEEDDILGAIHAGKSVENLETVRLRKDGTPIHLSVTVSPIKNALGEVTGVSKIAHDITERKAAKDNLLKEINFTETTIASLPGVFYVFDEDGKYLRWNKNLEMVTGYSAEEIRSIHPLDLFTDVDKPLVEKRIRAALIDGGAEVEGNFLSKDGTQTPYFFTGKRVVLDGKACIVGMGIDIAERKRAEAQLLHDAFHDGLTGLANRALFANHLQMAIERARRLPGALFAVLFLDFDRFKIINDSLGHAEGDKLLVQVARRLESTLRSGDLVARLGGDEFTILLGELESEEDAVQIAERIQSEMKNSFDLSARKVFTSASIGIALSRASYQTAEEMLRDADIAMYRAKAQGKACHQVFDQAMHRHAMSQLQLETEMRSALEHEEFLLHYQPIVNLESGRIVGFESLVRWRHHEHGMVSPAEFVPLAEENGFILPLGRWILSESCRQMRAWQLVNPAARFLTISVNLSSKQFQQQDLSEQVANALAETGLDPQCLKLEITESHVMENSETAIATLERLRALGVELSLDDFGTGYSSLSYLHRLPVSNLKIDRSFVSRMIGSEENSEIVRTIIRLAQNLKMSVVAEGVETEEQANYLKGLKCEYGQGFLFSSALDADQAIEFLLSNSEVTPPPFEAALPEICNL